MKKGVITDYSWRKKRVIYLILIIIFILLLPTFITMIYVFRHVKYTGVDDHTYYPYQRIDKSSDYRLSSIEHEITTEDDETLWCSEVPVDEPKCVVIYLGAMKEPSVTYFYGHAAWMKKLGYASFLLEVRAHGESSGRKLGLGYTEVEDVRALVRYVKSVDKYKNLPIVLHGVSLGGSIAINATAQIPEVSGCIAMSPFASPDYQLDLILKKHSIPSFLRTALQPFTHQAFRWIYGKDVADNVTPLQQIRNVGTKPVLVIASAHDEEISAENSYALQKVAEKAEFWIRDSSDHYVIKNNDFKGVALDTEYCTYVEGFIFKIIQATK